MSAAANEFGGVDDLGPGALLAALREVDLAERAAARDKLVLAYQWCVLHPATQDTGTAWWGHPRLPGNLDTDESLGGDGTPKVAAFSPEPFAAALGVSTQSGMTLLADALDLVHRLPRVWARIQDLSVPAWKARKVARDTHALSQDDAAYVDRELAPILTTAGHTRIERAIAQAIATVHPTEHTTHRETTGNQAWDVQLVHPRPEEFAGTSELFVRGDTLDLTRLHQLICATAAELAAAGDTDPLGARKAKALGLLADQQGSLDLRTAKTQLSLHLDLADLAEADAIAKVERLGPATTAKIRDWVGSSRVTIQPVLRLDRDDAVDTHDTHLDARLGDPA